jgi:arsenate reductase
VLFLCTHNSARSQIAEGLLRHMYGETYEVFSAGASPTRVNPFAIQAMAELGIDISKQYAKSIDTFRNTPLDYVVYVCHSNPNLACAVCALPSIGSRPERIEATVPAAKHYVHQGFSDPSEVTGRDEDKLAAFRQTRDDIHTWIRSYFADLKMGAS